MKKLFVPVVVTTILASNFAIVGNTAAAISEDQAGVISMTCGSVQLQLKNLQKTDSRVRVFLGSKYEFALTNLMTNLNLRLIRNNRPSSLLAASQSTFSNERDFFKTAFTDYSKSLDALLSINCRLNPYDFYNQLEITREKREIVRQSCLRLKDVLSDHRTTVVNLKDDL